MFAKSALHYENIAAAWLCLSIAVLLFRKGLAKSYGFLIALLAARGLMALVTVAILYHRKDIGLEIHRAYDLYFYAYWTSSVVQMLLEIGIVYSVYRIAMKPMEGLRRMGGMVFAWALSVSMIISLMVALGPHGQQGKQWMTLISQAHQGEGVLTMCLLLFVCFAARPLGLTYRSYAFGALLGLGFSETASLVLAAWEPTSAGMSLYSPVYAWASAISCATLLIWGIYFALPEPARQLVTLPTTSPYFHWNAVSEALRVDPGVVAIAGFGPSFMAPAELEALAASRPRELSEPQSAAQTVPQGLLAAAR
jgi:hypothetical protein